jgi:hypothetical protein
MWVVFSLAWCVRCVFKQLLRRFASPLVMLGKLRRGGPGFAIGILRSFGKCVANAWDIWSVTHNTATVMQNRAWQSETGCVPLYCDRSDYHRQRLVLADLDVCHC